MAKNVMYAIYDESLEAFVQLIPCANEKVAQMQLEKSFKEKRLGIPLLYDYPNHFKVYEIGSFDDNTGLFENIPQHKMLLEFGSLLSH